MINTEFITFLDNLFKPLSFKKKGSQWAFGNDSIIKIIKLMKSKYGNNYYLDYGFIIKELELDGLVMHFPNSLSSLDDIENARILELLDFDSSITDENRKEELKNFIEREILALFIEVNNEDDILMQLKKLKNLNHIPLSVKSHFQIPVD